MKVYSQLFAAQLENTTTDYSGTITGAVWFNTTELRAKVSNGTSAVALLANDGKAVFGTNGTAGNNVRFHRGAATLLQIVSGSDTTAEGTLSTSLGMISARQENYNNAGRPAAGNAGRIVWNTEAAKLQVDDGSTWNDVATGSGSSGGASGLEALQQKLANEKFNIVTEDLSSSAGLSGHLQPLVQVVTGTLLRQYTSGDSNIELVWNGISIDDASANMDSTTNWSTTGQAATLTATTTAGQFLTGTAALKFDKGALGTEAAIRKDTGAQTVSLAGNTDFWGYVFLPSTTNLSNVLLRVYADSTSNYRTWTVSTQFDGSGFSAGAWNLINIDISTGGTATGSGWVSSQLSRYREVGVTTTIIGQTYTGIIFDSCYFSYGDAAGLGVIGQEYTLFNDSTQNSVIIDSANTRYAGKLSLAASVANTYVGGSSGASRGRVYRQVLTVDGSDAIYFNTDSTFSGSITTLQKIRTGKILRGSLSGTWKTFVDVHGTQVYKVSAVGGSTIDVVDPVDDHLNLLNGDTVEIFQPLKMDGKKGYTLRASRAMTSNATASAGTTTLTLTTTSIAVGDIIVKRQVTSTLLSVVGVSANESWGALTVDASPNGIQLLDTSLGYLNPQYLYGHYPIGSYSSADAVRNKYPAGGAPNWSVNGTPNFGASFMGGRYGLVGEATSTARLFIPDPTSALFEANANQIQFAFWGYFDGAYGGSTRNWISRTTTGSNGFFIYTTSGATDIKLQVNSSATTALTPIVGWNHIVCVLNAGGNSYLIVNGVKSTVISGGGPTACAQDIRIFGDASLGYFGTGLRMSDLQVWRNGPEITLAQANTLWNRGLFLPSDFGPLVRYQHTSSALTGSKIGVEAQVERSTTAVRPVISKMGVIFNG